MSSRSWSGALGAAVLALWPTGCHLVFGYAASAPSGQDVALRDGALPGERGDAARRWTARRR